MKIAWLFLAWAVGTISFNLHADDEYNSQGIRQMVQRGEILSLNDILEKHPYFSGLRLLDLEVEREDGQVIYELEYLLPDGQVKKWLIDARSGDLLKTEGED